MAAEPRVLFVCEHGAAKSVLAATEFNALAEARGIPHRAFARGTSPDAAVSPVVVERLGDEAIDVTGVVPRALQPSDLQHALRVVTFDQPQVAQMVPAGVDHAPWNELPPVSTSFDDARRAIRARVQLIDDIARSV